MARYTARPSAEQETAVIAHTTHQDFRFQDFERIKDHNIA